MKKLFKTLIALILTTVLLLTGCDTVDTSSNVSKDSSPSSQAEEELVRGLTEGVFKHFIYRSLENIPMGEKASCEDVYECWQSYSYDGTKKTKEELDSMLFTLDDGTGNDYFYPEQIETFAKTYFGLEPEEMRLSREFKEDLNAYRRSNYGGVNKSKLEITNIEKTDFGYTVCFSYVPSHTPTVMTGTLGLAPSEDTLKLCSFEFSDTQSLTVPFNIYSFEEPYEEKTITFVCPKEWIGGGTTVCKDDSEYSKIIECMLRPADMVRETLESFPETEEKVIGNRTFTVTFEEYDILEKPDWHNYHIWCYYFFEGDKCYSIRFFQNQDTPAMSMGDFENMLADAKWSSR